MTAVWQLNEQVFRQNVRNVVQDNTVMAVVKNNAYNYGLTFAVLTFLDEGIHTFSTTSLSEAIRIREIAPHATIFLMNVSREFDLLRKHNIHMTLPS
ncbi:alanine racemase, partial [Staphylococcus chromogenes]